MLQPFQIIHGVLDAHRSLAVKLSRITGNSEQYYRQMGYEPKTSNPLMSGVNSPVADYMPFCELFQAALPGAGRDLSDRVHIELSNRFTEKDLFTTTQRDLHVAVIDEACDVQKWLASFDIETATKSDLATFENECAEAIGAIMEAQSRARARMRFIQLQRANGVAR